MKPAEVAELASALADLWRGTVAHVGLVDAWRLLERAYRYQVELEASHGVTADTTSAIGRMAARLQQSAAKPNAFRERSARCVVCRKAFRAVRAGAKYCGNTCKVRAKRKRLATVPAKAP